MSAIFGFNEAAAVAAIATMCGYQFTRYPFRKSTSNWFVAVMGRIMGQRMFMGVPFTWLMETALLTLTMFYFFQNTLADTWQFIAGTVLGLSYIVLLKVRYMTFWELRDPRMTAFVGTLAVLVGGALYAPLIAGTRSTPAVPPVGFTLVHEHLWYVPVITHSIHFVGLLISVGFFYNFWGHHFKKFKRHRVNRGDYKNSDEYFLMENNRRE